MHFICVTSLKSFRWYSLGRSTSRVNVCDAHVRVHVHRLASINYYFL